MILKGPFYIYFFAISLLFFERSDAGKIRVNAKANSIYVKEATKFLEKMNQSADPCVDFYNFTCGGYMKKPVNPDEKSPSIEKYRKMMREIKDIIESERDIPGSDLSVAREIYAHCMKIDPDDSKETELVDRIASKIGLIKGKYDSKYAGNVYYNWNNNFNWIDGVHKLREMGLNFRFLVGLYVSPRSESDKRNILEIRQPFLENDYGYISFSQMQENLTIIKIKELVDSLNSSFPVEKFIRGILPKDVKFSLEDDVSVDKAYIKNLAEALRNVSASYWASEFHNKISAEIQRLLPSKDAWSKETECLRKVVHYDYNFQAIISKTFFTEKKKAFVTEIINNVLNTTKKLINHSDSFDKESRLKSLKALSDLQVLVGYGNNIIKPPVLDWKDVDYFKYASNIFKLTKHQMDSKFRQINLVNDVREWEIDMIPTIYNAAYFETSNSLYMPALFVNSELSNIDLPSYIHYGTFGFTMGHELGHAIDMSAYYDRYGLNFEEPEISDYAGLKVKENKKCLRKAFTELTDSEKEFELDDFADLSGYKIAYYSFLDSDRTHEYDNLLPGMNYNARQMFWITSASVWCSKDAFEEERDGTHSRNYVRVMLPLANLPEFARDFNCPVGSPMNPKSKCEFL